MPRMSSSSSQARPMRATRHRTTLLRLVAAAAVLMLVLGVTLLQLTSSRVDSSSSNSNSRTALSPAHLLQTQRLLLRSALRQEEDRALKKKDKHKHKEEAVPATEAAAVEEGDSGDGGDEETLVDPTEAVVATEAATEPATEPAATEAADTAVESKEVVPAVTEPPPRAEEHVKKHAKDGSDLLVPKNQGQGPEETVFVEGKTFIMDLQALIPPENHHRTRGHVTIVTHPEWAPLGAQHFHELVEAGFYDDCRFFRVVNDFMVQFGINGDPAVQKQWKEIILEDDPVLHTNDRATVSFATSGPNTRTTQLFINTKTDGNAFLDKQGFSPFAEIVNGMEYVDHIYAEYGEKPSQGKITKQGNAYLQEKYPLLSYVKHIYEEEKEDTEEAT